MVITSNYGPHQQCSIDLINFKKSTAIVGGDN